MKAFVEQSKTDDVGDLVHRVVGLTPGMPSVYFSGLRSLFVPTRVGVCANVELRLLVITRKYEWFGSKESLPEGAPRHVI